jgi:hypothetical protein
MRGLSAVSDQPISRLSGVAPIMMSLVALLAVVKAAVNYEHDGPPLDEDGPWHVFLLMLFMQLPIIWYFVFRSRREFPRALPVLVTQMSLWAISLGAGYYFPGLY